MSHSLSPVHASYDDLVRYIQGRLATERLSVTDPHLRDCDICRESLSKIIKSHLILHLAAKTKADQKRERSEPRFSTGSEAIVQILSPLSLDRHKVKIVDISKNGVGIVTAQAALPGTIMQVRINTAVELGEVRYCSACEGNEYRIGVRFIAVPDEKAELFVGGIGDLQIPLGQQTDRRRGARQPLSQSVVVSVLRNGRILHGEIRDLSEGGAQILLREPLDLASSIKIEFADKTLLGEVVYCRQEQPGWVLGIRLERALSELSEALGKKRGSQI